MPDASQPRIIADKYVVGPLLGRGAVGEVYLARHRLTGAEVALKVIPSRMIGSEPSLQRFHREVSVANRVGHPGMVKVHDAGWSEAEDAYYLAMERLSGQSLGAWADGPEVDLRSAVLLVRAMLEPLAAAHAAGIVHRDLKPENVFLHQDPRTGERVVKLLDFGIARDQRELLSATLADITLGTPAYMSPEQATSAKEATPASDVWSVGVILYWLYSGRLPFEHETVFNTLTAICTLPHPELQGATASERALIAVIEACLRKDPGERPPDAGALGAALDRWLEDAAEPTTLRPRADTEVRPFAGDEGVRGLTLIEAPPRRGRRGLAGLLLVGLAVGLGWWTLRTPAATTAASPPTEPARPAPAPTPQGGVERTTTPVELTESEAAPALIETPSTEAIEPAPPRRARVKSTELRRAPPPVADSAEAGVEAAPVANVTAEPAPSGPAVVPDRAEALTAPSTPEADPTPSVVAPAETVPQPVPAKTKVAGPARAAPEAPRPAPAPPKPPPQKPFVTF